MDKALIGITDCGHVTVISGDLSTKAKTAIARKARAAFVLAGREDDAEWIATAIDGVKSAQSQIRNGE